MQEFIDFCKEQHDIVCNQKYSGDLPYSFHLNIVAQQELRFKHLLSDTQHEIAHCACWGHDLIEDARCTYNDVKNRIIGVKSKNGKFENIAEKVADVVYLCTDEKGKNRSEHHSDIYFNELSKSDIAVFVKLCDLIANITYSLLINSSMYGKYKKEYPNVKEKLYRPKYKEMFDHIEKLLEI